MDQQLTGYERKRQAIIDAMNQQKPPLEEVRLPSGTIVKRRIANKESFGWHCWKATITHNGQPVPVYTKDEQRYWSLDMSVVL